MRRYLLAACILSLPISAHSEMRCATPVTVTTGIQLLKPVDVTGTPVPLAPHNTSDSAQHPPEQTPTSLIRAEATRMPEVGLTDSNVAKIPVLAHVAEAGAQLSDLGTTHRMRTVIARHDGQFMVFEVAPDGQAAVSGLMMDVTVDQLKQIGGQGVVELKPAHGLQAFLIHNGARFQLFYATPDGQRVIPGVLWDASGKDLSRDQVASVPGTIPTVEIGKDLDAAASSIHRASAQSAPNAVSSWMLVSSTNYGSIGDTHAPELFMFIDPQCSFSVRAMQQLRPYVAQGQVHLNVIPVSLLDREDHGLSTSNATALLGTPPEQMVQAWENGHIQPLASSDAARKLQANMKAASAIDLKGTPTFLWRKSDGGEGRVDGLPNDVAAMIAELRS